MWSWPEIPREVRPWLRCRRAGGLRQPAYDRDLSNRGCDHIPAAIDRDGSYSVSVAPHTSLPLDGYTSAHIDSIWNMSDARLIVIGGAGADCQLRYTLVIAASDTASLHSIGDCGDTYSFARYGNALAIRQTGVRDPKLWTFKDGMLDGPTIQIARPSGPRPTRSARRVRATTSATRRPCLP